VDLTEVRYEVDDGVATITLHRPERRNAFTLTMAAELAAAAEAADADDAVRVVVVTGAGRAFCVGADLGGGPETFADRRHKERPPGPLRQEIGGFPRDAGGVASLPFAALRKPVIAAVNGPAVGIGATLTLPMDIRIAAESARFGFVFARVGIVPEAASSWFLPRVVGISQAMEWVATGRVFDADEAERGGLVRSVHSQEDLLPFAHHLAREIAGNTAPVSVALARKLMWRGLGMSHPMQAHQADSRAMFSRGQSADAVEGVTSFLEKRPASYPDKVSDGLPDLELEEPQWS